jgi:hypothetical protein
MKRFGIVYATRLMREKYNEWDYFWCHADSEQEAVALLLRDTFNVKYCIANIVEWKGDPNGQYILTAA